jgi:hypothetical protein
VEEQDGIPGTSSASVVDAGPLPRATSEALLERLEEAASQSCGCTSIFLFGEAAGEIRRLQAVADFERGFRIATDLKLGEVLGRKP